MDRYWTNTVAFAALDDDPDAPLAIAGLYPQESVNSLAPRLESVVSHARRHKPNTE